MARKPRDVTDAELAILNVLWETHAATVRELSEQLYSGSSASDLATVQKLLKRLEDKGCVRKESTTRPTVFRPRIRRGALINRRLADTADALCAGEYTPLLTHLVRAKKLSRSERNELRRLLDDCEQGA